MTLDDAYAQTFADRVWMTPDDLYAQAFADGVWNNDMDIEFEWLDRLELNEREILMRDAISDLDVELVEVILRR